MNFLNTITDNIDLFIVEKDGTELHRLTKTSKSEYTVILGHVEKIKE
ncbi:hypothetical protein [Aquimarina sp. AU474]|nr:hypothetical protein [Aquimarina sp. AU474]